MTPEHAHTHAHRAQQSHFQLVLKTTRRLEFTRKQHLLLLGTDPSLGSATEAVILTILQRHTAFTFGILQTAFRTSQDLPYKVLNYLLNVPRLHERLSLRTLRHGGRRLAIRNPLSWNVWQFQERQGNARSRAGRILNLTTIGREEQIKKKIPCIATLCC